LFTSRHLVADDLGYLISGLFLLTVEKFGLCDKRLFICDWNYFKKEMQVMRQLTKLV